MGVELNGRRVYDSFRRTRQWPDSDEMFLGRIKRSKENPPLGKFLRSLTSYHKTQNFIRSILQCSARMLEKSRDRAFAQIMI